MREHWNIGKERAERNERGEKEQREERNKKGEYEHRAERNERETRII